MGAERSLDMHLVGQLYNLSASLERVLAAPAPTRRAAQSSDPPAVGRLGNGVVQRAIAKVLVAADGPMRLRDIHAAVGRILGRPVSYASVEWCLRMGVKRKAPQFERVQPGSYRLAR